jgi:hypothetical protein
MGLQPDFKFEVNGLPACYCNTQPAGLITSYDARLIKVKDLTKFTNNMDLIPS